MEFTDKEGSFFFKDNEKDPVQKSSPSEQDTKCWQLLLRFGAGTRRVGYKGDDETFTDSPLSVVSLLSSRLHLFLQELSVLWTLPDMVQQVRHIFALTLF